MAAVSQHARQLLFSAWSASVGNLKGLSARDYAHGRRPSHVNGWRQMDDFQGVRVYGKQSWRAHRVTYVFGRRGRIHARRWGHSKRSRRRVLTGQTRGRGVLMFKGPEHYRGIRRLYEPERQ
jgi:hypothetical protein